MFVLVAVPVPGLDLLTYRVPEGVAMPAVGARVLVPLGTRVVTGLVVEADVRSETGAEPAGRAPAAPVIKPIRSVMDAHAFVPAQVVALARWTAEYYAAGVGDTITALLPPMARGGRVDSHKTTRVATITIAGTEALASPDALTAKQRDALALLAGVPTGIGTAALAARGVAGDAVSRLAKRGLISLRQDRVDRDPFKTAEGLAAPGAVRERRLTAEQDAALGRLRALAGANAFRVALLHGVTGSGKTELYLRLAAAVGAAGRRALMLVPEIALTPAVAGLFREAFGERVAIQHSGLSDGERHDQWQRIRRGDIDVVVGTRSAVFAPLEQVGLIVVDEEHDGSYKQDESPRYNGRDVAIVRGQRAGALVVLGSATP